ncbi:MAG: histidinol dehydrogenase, partial [Alphaproteobacteria bacterium]
MSYPTVALHHLSKLSPTEREVLLARAEDDLEPFIEQVKPLIEEVRSEGDVALARFAKRFDKADIGLDQIAATKADFDAAFNTLDPEFISVLEYSADNIRRFH